MTTEHASPAHWPAETLIAEYGLSRALVVQWTVVSLLGVVVSLFGLLALYYGLTGDASGVEFVVTPETGWWNLGLSIIFLVGMAMVVIVPHELCHGLAINVVGGKPRYGLGVAYLVFPYAFATSETRFSRNQFVVVALAPLVILSAIGIPVMVAVEWPWLAVPLALNAGGAAGDLWMVATLLGYPSTVTIVDTTTGLEIYGPPSLERREIAPVSVLWHLIVGIAGSVVLLAVGGGIGVPLALAVLGVDALVVGVPDTPLVVLEFLRTPDGSVEFTMGTGLFAIGACLGLVYAYLRSNGRPDRFSRSR